MLWVRQSRIHDVAKGYKSENTDRIVTNVVPLDRRSILPVLEKLNGKTKKNGGRSRPKRETSAVAEADRRKESQCSEAHEVGDLMGRAEMEMCRPLGL